MSMDNKYQNCAKIMKTLSSTTRLQIIDMLSHGEMCADTIQEHIEMSQPTISYHMKVLCESGLVDSRPEGKWTRYKISKKGCNEVMALLEEITTPNAAQKRYLLQEVKDHLYNEMIVFCGKIHKYFWR